MTGPWGEAPPEETPGGKSGGKPGGKSGGPRALNCPSCGAPIIVRAAGATVSVICGNCGSTLDATDPDLKLIHQSAEALAKPAIALGTRGVLGGVEWEVVGYLERSGDDVDWQEYLLFNPWEGYRFLIHVEGDWRLGQAIDRVPDVVPGSASLDGQIYEGGEDYDARVDFVVGEFYWRVAVGETVTASEYSAWGASLSREANGAEVSWTRIDGLPGDTVAAAFGLTPPAEPEIPADGGQWPHGRTLFFSIIIAGIALVALVIALIAKPSATLVVQNTFMVEFGAPAATHVIGPIEQARASSAIQVKATTNVDNAWVELDFALVERRTQQRYEASTTAEYYTGTDSDGRWSEGEARPDVKFSSIPRGSYDLIVEAKASKWQPGGYAGGGFDSNGRWQEGAGPGGPPVAVTIGIVRDTAFGSSFLLATLAILAWPAWLAWRHVTLRQRRGRSW